MELLEPIDDAAMECDVQEDDLLGEELMDVEEKAQLGAGSSKGKVDTKSTKSVRGGSRANAPLGVKTKKTEFLRRGSPRMRVVMSTKHSEVENSRRRGHNKEDGLMGSNNPSKHH